MKGGIPGPLEDVLGAPIVMAALDVLTWEIVYRDVITLGTPIVLGAIGLVVYYFRRRIDQLFHIADQANDRAAVTVKQTSPTANGFAATMLEHVERTERRWVDVERRLGQIEEKLCNQEPS